MKIKGNRVSLSRVTSNDLEFISELECNNEIWFFEEYIESDKGVVKEKYLEKINSKHSYDFIIEKIQDGVVIPVGIVQIWNYVEHRKSWELGFAVLPEHQGNGFGYEAVNLMLEFVFNNLEAHKVIGMCNCNNQKSSKLMEKLGMSREGVFKKELFWCDEWHDQYFYAILDSEYKANKLNLSSSLM